MHLTSHGRKWGEFHSATLNLLDGQGLRGGCLELQENTCKAEKGKIMTASNLR